MDETFFLELKHVTKDGRYLGILINQQLPVGTIIKTKFVDNGNLEHILKGTVVSNPETDAGLYSHLLELDELAPQRVRDFYKFTPESDMAVGEVTEERVRVYTNMVLKEGALMKLTLTDKKIGKPMIIKGLVELEDDVGIPPGKKYCFLIKFTESLSEEDYSNLKKMDIDDMTNYEDQLKEIGDL